MDGKHHVSGRITASMLIAAGEMPWPYEVDLEAVGLVDEDRLRSTSAWLGWEEYLAVLRALSGGLDTPDAYLESGILTMDHAAQGTFRALGTLTGGVTALYKAVFGWVMRMLLPEVEMVLTEVGPGQLHITVRVDPSLPPSQAYFHTLRGSLTALPRALGRPDAVVAAEVHDHEASYEVTLPARADLWARAKRGWRAMVDQSGHDEAFLHIRAQMDDLVGALHQANAELRAAREREQRLLAAQKMEALARLSGGLAHDLNNLLAALQGHADLLEYKFGSVPGIRTHIEGISGLVGSASELTRQLLLYARKQPARPQTMDLVPFVDAYCAAAVNKLAEGVTLRTDLPEEVEHVHIDPTLLHLVLDNLVVNAQEAMPEGGQITVSTRLAREGDGEWVDLRVADEGVGMPEDVRARAVEPFFTTKGPGRGTGLGLSTVHWIVDRAGGRVELDSAVGKGTTARVRLPRVYP